MTKRVDYAAPVPTPRWVCFLGSCVIVVAVETEHDARVLVRDRLQQRHIAHSAREIRVRRLTQHDLDSLERIEAQSRALGA